PAGCSWNDLWIEAEGGCALREFKRADALPCPRGYLPPMGFTDLRVAPVKSWRGRPILYSGSAIISFNCAIQPTVRASAKIAVNSGTGMPIAFCTMPE